MASTVLGAIARAILFWIGLYVFMAHCYVYWNWEATSGLMPTNNDNSNTNNDNNDDSMVDKPVPTKRRSRAQDPLVKYNLTRDELDELLELTPIEPIALIPLDDQDDGDLGDDDEEIIDESSASTEDLETLQRQIEQAEVDLEHARDEIKSLENQISSMDSAFLELETANRELTQDAQDGSSLEDDDVEPMNHFSDINGRSIRTTDSHSLTTWKLLASQLKYFDENKPQIKDGTQNFPMSLEKALSRVNDLNDLQPISELDYHFESVFQALDKWDGESNDDKSWTQFTRMLRRNYPSKVNKKGQNSELVCKGLAGSDDDEEDDDNDDELLPPEDAVTKGELAERLQELQSMMDESYEETVPLILESSRKEMESHVATLVQKWAIRVEHKAQDMFVTQQAEHWNQHSKKQKVASTAAYTQDDNEEDDGHCIRLEQVDALLEAGLRAVERKEDLRRSLLTTMSMQGIDTSGIILDAALDDEPGPPSRGADPELQFTWRQILDRPLTKTVAQSWLPFVLDVIGGYNDSLDSWLDQTVPVEALVSGQTLRQVLDWAGKKPLSPSMTEWLLSSSSAGR